MLALARLCPSVLLDTKTHTKPCATRLLLRHQSQQAQAHRVTWYSSSPAQAPSRQTPPAGREQRPAAKHELHTLPSCSRADRLQGRASPRSTQEYPQKEGESHGIPARSPGLHTKAWVCYSVHRNAKNSPCVNLRSF